MGRGGQKKASDEDLSTNPTYAPFCGEYFDAMEFASHSLSASSTTAQVRRAQLLANCSGKSWMVTQGFQAPLHCSQAKTIQLQEGIKALHDRIRQEVERRQDDLLQQAESLREAQSFMQA